EDDGGGGEQQPRREEEPNVHRNFACGNLREVADPASRRCRTEGSSGVRGVCGACVDCAERERGRETEKDKSGDGEHVRLTARKHHRADAEAGGGRGETAGVRTEAG